MTINIESMSVIYTGSHIKDGKKYHFLKLDFKFNGAKKITGHVIDSNYYIVGQFRKKKEGNIILETHKFGYFTMVVVDSYNIHRGKKVKFYIEQKSKKKSSSSSGSSSYHNKKNKKSCKCLICKQYLNTQTTNEAKHNHETNKCHQSNNSHSSKSCSYDCSSDSKINNQHSCSPVKSCPPIEPCQPPTKSCPPIEPCQPPTKPCPKLSSYESSSCSSSKYYIELKKHKKNKKT